MAIYWTLFLYFGKQHLRRWIAAKKIWQNSSFRVADTVQSALPLLDWSHLPTITAMTKANAYRWARRATVFLGLIIAIIRLIWVVIELQKHPLPSPPPASYVVKGKDHVVQLVFRSGKDPEWPNALLQFKGNVKLVTDDLTPRLKGSLTLQEIERPNEPGNDHTAFAQDIDERLDLPPDIDLTRAIKIAVVGTAGEDQATTTREFPVYEFPAGHKNEHDNVTANGVVSHWKYNANTKEVTLSTPAYTLKVLRKRTLIETIKLFMLRYIGIGS